MNELKNKKDVKPHLESVYGKFFLPSTTIEEFEKRTVEIENIPKKYVVAKRTDDGRVVRRKASWVEKRVDDVDSTELFCFGLESKYRGMVSSTQHDGECGGEFKLRNKNIRGKTGKVLKGADAVLAVRQSLNLDREMLIPLPHSHFSIELSSFSPAEKIKLSEMITESLTDYCSQTLGLIFSHDSVVYYKAIFQYLRKKIISHTLIIPEDKDILDYIDVRDITSILAYLSAVMHPKGVDTIVTCRNKMKVDNENEKLLCTNTVTGLLDAKNMLYIKEQNIPESGKSLLRKTKSNSITIEEMMKSREEAPYHNSKEMKYGDSLIITVESSSISKYLESGDSYINRLVELIDDAVTLIDDPDERKREVNKFLALLVVNRYSHFISSVEIENVGIITDQETIFKTLEDLLEEYEMGVNLVTDISDSVNTDKLSYIGVSAFTCKECKKTMKEDDKIEFDGTIELNALEVFSNLRII
jgi:hypothetical protein